MQIKSPDEDGEYPPYTISHSRHEAWAWDQEKKIRWGGKQKAPPTYRPTFLECLLDNVARRLYFGKDPALHVQDRIAARARHAALKADHDEKHAPLIATI